MSDGGSSKACSCLCGLVGRHLRQHAVVMVPQTRRHDPFSLSVKEEGNGAPPSFANEQEKDLLISLTVACREIKKWTEDFEYRYEQVADATFFGDCPCHQRPPFDCSANIILLLVVFLSSSSMYVQHTAGKVLVATSNLFMQNVCKWEDFVRLLWISFQTAIYLCASSNTSESSILNIVPRPQIQCKYKDPTINECSDHDSYFISSLRSRIKFSGWSMVSGLTQALHTLQKSIKSQDNFHAESYLKFAVTSVLRIPLKQLGEVYAAESSGSCISRDVFGGNLDPSSLFLGSLLKVLCSLVEQDHSEGWSSPLDEVFIYVKFANLIPDLLTFCFSVNGRYNSCMYQYLRHKVLVLMIRLSSWSHWQFSAVVSWLQLIYKYFKDILHQPILTCNSGQDMSTEGSPFLASVTGGWNAENICTAHLQRQTIFVFLKCCFALVHFDGKAGHECTSTFKLQRHGETCCFNGVQEISDWLKKHVPMDDHINRLNYLESCGRFSLSFLQLYMSEDDLLFEMLLQLLDASFPPVQRHHFKHQNLNEKDNDGILHISVVFDPIGLFHLFLSLIHYDHSVLLDYLISKYTGIRFVKYLLRCLRLICNSWSSFVEFSTVSGIAQPHHKRRKLSTDGQDHSKTQGVAFPAAGAMNVSGALRTGDSPLSSSRNKKPKQMSQDAKECLLSLQKAVEDLHRKNLFPYNPAPLLRCFARFMELCGADPSTTDIPDSAVGLNQR